MFGLALHLSNRLRITSFRFRWREFALFNAGNYHNVTQVTRVLDALTPFVSIIFFLLSTTIFFFCCGNCVVDHLTAIQDLSPYLGSLSLMVNPVQQQRAAAPATLITHRRPAHPLSGGMSRPTPTDRFINAQREKDSHSLSSKC